MIKQIYWKFISLALSFLLVFFFTQCSERHKISLAKGLVIENATIISFDSTNTLNKFNGCIALDSNRIVYVGESRPDLKGWYTTIDANGKYIIPGLIDSHVHLANMAGMTARLKRKNPKLRDEYFNNLGQNFLYFGYTTLIDLNAYDPKIIVRLAGSECSPDIYTCGEQLMIMDGFMMEMGEMDQSSRYQIPFLHDHYNLQVNYPDSINLEDHSYKNAINRIVSEQQGVCAKLLYEDEFSGLKVTWEKPSQGLLKDILSEAKNYGIPVILHAPSFEGQSNAVGAKVDIIAHAMWNWFSDPKRITETELPSSHRALLHEIAAFQIGYQPTFSAITGEQRVLEGGFLNDTILTNIYSNAYIKWLNSEEGKWIERRMKGRPGFIKRTNPLFYWSVRRMFENDEHMMDSIYKVLEKRINAVVKYLETNEGRLLFGTDFGVMNMYTVPPGYGGYLEMKSWYNAGVSLKTILKAATFDNARAFHLEKLYGTIKEGNIANLLILKKDPLKTVDAYNSIENVIIRGELKSRNNLRINASKGVLSLAK